MIKIKRSAIFSLILIFINTSFGQNNHYTDINALINTNYKSIIDNKLFESKTTSFSKANDGTIYAGRYSYGSKLEDSSVLKSVNNGQTWEKIGNFPIIENSPKIYETIVKVDPNNSNVIFIYFITESEEIFPVLLKSIDAGISFEKISFQSLIDGNDLDKIYSLDLHIDSSVENSTYLLINGMSNSKIYRLNDDYSFSNVNIDCNYFDIIISFAVSRQNPNTMYASGFTCLYKSSNKGISWETTSCSTSFDNSFKKLKIDPFNDKIVYGIPYKLNKSYNSEIIKLTNDGGYNFETKYSENFNSKNITAQGVTIDIDSKNKNKTLVTFLIIDHSKEKENSEYQKSKIIESIDYGQNFKAHEPDLGTYNTVTDAIYITNNLNENSDYNVLLSSQFNLYKGKTNEEGYISNWNVIPFKYQ